MYIFFSSTTLAGGQACRCKEIEGDLEIKSRRDQLHLVGADLGPRTSTSPVAPRPSLLALLRPLIRSPYFAMALSLAQDITDSGPRGLRAEGRQKSTGQREEDRWASSKVPGNCTRPVEKL